MILTQKLEFSFVLILFEYIIQNLCDMKEKLTITKQIGNSLDLFII